MAAGGREKCEREVRKEERERVEREREREREVGRERERERTKEARERDASVRAEEEAAAEDVWGPALEEREGCSEDEFDPRLGGGGDEETIIDYDARTVGTLSLLALLVQKYKY